MNAEPTRLEDPAALAAAVRSLARQSHRMLNDPEPSAIELRMLMRRARRLRRLCAGLADDSLSRWLTELHRRLCSLGRVAVA